MGKLNFGISSWCYPWSMGVVKGPQPPERMTWLDLLSKAVEMEVNLVQIADNLPLEGLSNSELDDLKSFADDNSISLEVGTKGIEESHLLTMLDIALKLDSPLLRILPAFFGSSAILQDVESKINRVLPRFEKEGVTMVLENTEAFKAAEYAGLMQRVNHPNFQMCVDLANGLGIMEGPEFVLEKLIAYCGNFHFKDVEVRRSETVVGFTVLGTPAGKGGISLSCILEQLELNHKYPSIIIELWPTWQGNIEETMILEDRWTRESVAYMKSVMT
jgi:sugar phosphate isomerase/epimerase